MQDINKGDPLKREKRSSYNSFLNHYQLCVECPRSNLRRANSEKGKDKSS